MRKLAKVLLAGVAALSLTACGQAEGTTGSSADTTAKEQKQQETPEKIKIQSLNANGEEISLEVPYDPERIAVLDMAALDILDNLGVGDKIVGSASTSLEYLSDYVDNEKVANLGTIKEADLEAVMECEPEVTKNAETIASMFGLEDEVKEKTAGFDERIEALAEKAKGHTALVGMTTSGSFNLMGNDGRCSIIGVEIGFDNLTAAESTSTHGNEASFETVVEKNPEYIFVMDRDQAIGADGAQTAKEIMENELVMQTDAYKNGKIIYLEHPAVWYTAEGGITALDVMLSDLEESL